MTHHIQVPIQLGQYIDGQWVSGHGGALVSHDPVFKNALWEGSQASVEQVDEAVKAGRQAFDGWRKTPLENRIKLIREFGKQLVEHKESLAYLIGIETGKPLWESRTEVAAMIGKIEISIDAYQLRTGITEKEVAAGHSVIRHHPHGVVAVFGPYNFPGHLPNGHILPALLAGNTVIFKPSEQTPLVAQETIKLWELAGLPNGVINLVQGAAETGKALAVHSDVNGIFFTGSSKVGHLLHQQAAGQPEKILALEMGGNNPLIVHHPSDIEGAVHHTIFSAFISAGQRCTCARRLFVPIGDDGDAFVNRLVDVTRNIKVGVFDADPQPFMGSLISREAAINMLRAEKALLQAGGHSLVSLGEVMPDTALLSPGIIDVTKIQHIPDEEHFGPLLQLYRYDSFDSAIEMANATKYGLSAGLICDDINRYRHFAEEVRAGIINWNKPLTGASSAAPFGGVGASGNHRPGALYAADYCAYPVASLEAETAEVPEHLSPGLKL